MATNHKAGMPSVELIEKETELALQRQDRAINDAIRLMETAALHGVASVKVGGIEFTMAPRPPAPTVLPSEFSKPGLELTEEERAAILFHSAG